MGGRSRLHEPAPSTSTPSMATRRVDVDRDLAELVPLYRRLFGQEITEAQWLWKFQPPWVREPLAWVAESEGRIVAHLGAVPLRGQLDGHEATFFQLGDIMMDPELRSMDAYATVDPSLLLSELEASEPGGVAYGFSGEAVGFWYRWFSDRGDAVHVEPAPDRLFRPVPTAFRGASGIEIVPWSWAQDGIDRVWEEQRGWIAAGLIRDRSYLQWRYAEHPAYGYDLFGVLLRGDPVGWIVVSRDREAPGPGSELRVQDLLLAPPLRVPALRQAADTFQVDPAVAWLPASSVPAGVESRPSGWQVMYRSLSASASPERLARSVFYTLGEADQWWW